MEPIGKRQYVEEVSFTFQLLYTWERSASAGLDMVAKTKIKFAVKFQCKPPTPIFIEITQ
jgi:hypothetical protein